jgi:PIN domain nuclease of toxin-antitoxin system
MKLLLDTHALLWWLQDNPNLGPRARALIADADNELAVSIASPWEISIKHRTGKLDESGSVILRWLESEKIEVIQLTPEHLEEIEKLPVLHRDPFDHVIIAQAKVVGATIITNDHRMPSYGVPCVST